MSDLRAATSAGIPPAVMTVHADRLDESQLHGVGRLAPGRVVLGCTRHIEAVAGGLAGREQNVLLCMGDHATDADGRRFACHSRDTDLAVRELMDRRHCSLIGLHGDISVVTDLIAQMDHIRRCHGVVLTRLVLDGAGRLASGDSVRCRDVAEEIAESVDDACATLRFPRPAVVICVES